jgi:parallel beta-helix repeat protein
MQTYSRELLRVGAILLLMFTSFQSIASSKSQYCNLPKDELINGGYILLEKSCVFNESILITKSNTILDCNNSIIDGQGRLNNGVMIISQGKSIRNILVKNCTIKNFKHSGIGVSSGISPEKLSPDHKRNYDNSPTDIIIDNVTVETNAGVGVYIDDYVTKTIIKNSVIKSSGSTGIYLDQSSKFNQVINNVIENNGFPTEEGRGEREGLAIDSSANNIIEGNKFINNAAGGVFLYKNCGEAFKTGKSVIRWQHSDFNIIKNNFFSGQPIGVWIASRQSRDLSKWGCGDDSMDKEKHFYQDFSKYNKVVGNEFCRNKIAIKIEDDNNIIKNNSFDEDVSKQINIPMTMREKLLGEKTIGNDITENENKKCDH